MCSQPIPIKNRTFHYKRGFDKFRFQVPCGNCPSCRHDEQISWYLRANAEFNAYKGVGGCVVFITLTYNDNFIPVFHDKILGKNFKFNCFSLRDRQLYVKRLRKNIETYFGYSPSNIDINGRPKLPIKAFIVSEFGEKYKRPHYHAAIYIPPLKKFNAHELLQLCANTWRYKKIVNNRNFPFIDFCLNPLKYANFSFIHQGKKLNICQCVKEIGFAKYSTKGAFINDNKALKYVCKYISKDINFYHKEDINEYVAYLRKLKNSDEEEYKLHSSRFHKSAPTHIQGRYFGKCIADDFMKNDDNMIDAIRNGVRVIEDMEVKRYPIPRYIKNTLIYDYEKKLSHTGRYIKDASRRYLTSFGFDYMAELLNANLEGLTQTYSKLLTDIRISALSNKEIVRDFPTIFSAGSTPLSNIRNLTNNASARDLAAYQLFYKDYAYSSDMKTGISKESKLDLLTKKAIGYGYIRLVRACKPLEYICNSRGVKLSPILDDVEIYMRQIKSSFNNLKQFQNYDLVLNFLTRLQGDQKHTQCSNDEHNFNVLRTLKEKINETKPNIYSSELISYHGSQTFQACRRKTYDYNLRKC